MISAEHDGWSLRAFILPVNERYPTPFCVVAAKGTERFNVEGESLENALRNALQKIEAKERK